MFINPKNISNALNQSYELLSTIEEFHMYRSDVRFERANSTEGDLKGLTRLVIDCLKEQSWQEEPLLSFAYTKIIEEKDKVEKVDAKVTFIREKPNKISPADKSFDCIRIRISEVMGNLAESLILIEQARSLEGLHQKATEASREYSFTLETSDSLDTQDTFDE